MFRDKIIQECSTGQNLEYMARIIHVSRVQVKLH
jgi:hypothetical protein